MNKYNSSKLVKDIISASSSPTVCNQSLTNSCLAQQDKLSVVKGFTLIEVMIVTTILATLATTTVVALNPVELLAQMRDSQRITTIGMLRDAVSLLVADRPATNLGDITRVYISLPSNNVNCTDIVGLPALPAGQTYRCVTAANLTRIDGGGWIPLDFRGITDGSPFTVLPIDVTNTPTLFYSYIPSAGGRVTLSARIESIRQRTIHPTGIFTTHFTATVDRPPLGTGQVVVPLGTAGAPSYTFIGDLNTGIFSPGADAIGLSTAGTIRMSIDNMGNVGIGTPTPGNRLTVAGIIHSTTGGFMFPDGTIQITAGGGAGGGTLPAGTLAGQTLRWTGTAWVANDNLFNTGSNVGIGTTVPATNLHVSNPGGHGLLRVEGRAGQGGVQIVSSGTFSPFINFGTGGVVGNMGVIFADGATGNMQFRTADNINRLIITNTTGNIGIGTTSPLSRVQIQGHGTTTAGALNVTASDGASRFFVRDDGNVGIGTTTPTTRLDIEGQIRIRGGSPAVGRVLTSDATGLAVWAVPTGGLPTGTVSQTLRHDGTTWVANNNLFNTGTNVGIGTTTPDRLFHIRNAGGVGQAVIQGLQTSGTGNAARLWLSTASTENIDEANQIGRQAYIEGFATGSWGTNVRLDFATSNDVNISPTPRMTILADGNIGIGTTAPTTRLDIEGQIRIRGGSPAVGRVLTSDATGLAVWTAPTGGLPSGHATQTLRHDGTSWVGNSNLVNTGTNVGIGTTNPLSRVQIQGHGTTTAGALNITDSAGTSRFFVRDDGNVGIGTTAPTSPLHVMNLPLFADNAAARAGGLTIGAFYRTKEGTLMVVSPTSYFLFSSGTTHTGNLGGRTGANNICRTSATRPAICSAHNTWAFISISGADEVRDFPSNMPAWTGGMAFNTGWSWYWRHGTSDGVRAANSWSDLLDGTVQNVGTLGGMPDAWHWTGTWPDGAVTSLVCGSWSGDNMLWSGEIGRPNSVENSVWLNLGTIHRTVAGCSNLLSIYCACF